MKKTRSFTLVEMMVVTSIMGTFFLISGPLTIHLVSSIRTRTRSFDHLVQLSRFSDKFRIDLKDKKSEVLTVTPDRLVIRSGENKIEYKIKNTKNAEIERIQNQGRTVMWIIPNSSIKFSQTKGKNNAVLIGLHCDFNSKNMKKIKNIEMDFAALGPKE